METVAENQEFDINQSCGDAHCQQCKEFCFLCEGRGHKTEDCTNLSNAIEELFADESHDEREKLMESLRDVFKNRVDVVKQALEKREQKYRGNMNIE